MTRSKHRRWRRRATTRPLSESIPSAASAMPLGGVERLLSLPVLDRLFSRLLAHPRVLQIVGMLLGIVIAGLALRSLLSSAALVSTTISAAPGQAMVTTTQRATSAGSDTQAVIDLIAAYNQASIAGAVLNRADAMEAYLAPDGSAWTEVQAEYQRRITKIETHSPALSRWGILRVTVDTDTATVETQEQWDDLMSVGGQLVSSRRGILTQNVYALRRVPGSERWLITTITTTNIID